MIGKENNLITKLGSITDTELLILNHCIAYRLQLTDSRLKQLKKFYQNLHKILKQFKKVLRTFKNMKF